MRGHTNIKDDRNMTVFSHLQSYLSAEPKSVVATQYPSLRVFKQMYLLVEPTWQIVFKAHQFRRGNYNNRDIKVDSVR